MRSEMPKFIYSYWESGLTKADNIQAATKQPLMPRNLPRTTWDQLEQVLRVGDNP